VIASQQWELVEIDLEKSLVDLKKSLVDEDVEVPEIDETKIKQILYNAVKNRLYDDLSYQIVANVLLQRSTFSSSSDKDIQGQTSIDYFFSLPFERYFTEAYQAVSKKEITYETLDNAVIKKTSQLYYNDKLPTPYLPLLAREHIQTPD